MATSAQRGRAPLAAPKPGTRDHSGAQSRADATRHGRRPGWFEWATLAVFAAVCCWLIAVNLHFAHHGLVWTGIDGEFPVDQMQFLAWIQDASRHVLTSDLFVLRSTAHVYLHPMFALSGGLVALGTPAWVAFIAWKPVAIVAVFFAIWAWCGRLLDGRWERRAALVVALFAGGGGVLGDEWLPFMAWGYPHAVLALALMVAALLAYDRVRLERRVSMLAPALGLFASWVHPWQGEVLIVVVGLVELVRVRESLRRGIVRSLSLPALTVAATAAPLIYYGILGRVDLAWRLGQGALLHSWPLGRILVPLIPLLVLSAPVYLRRPKGILQATAMAWPIAALIVYAVNASGFAGAPQHAWVGIAVPLAVLSVQGVRSFWLPTLGRTRVAARAFKDGSPGNPAGRLGGPAGRALVVALAVLAVGAVTIPGGASTMRQAHTFVGPGTNNQNLLKHSELRALNYLANDPEPGGVLSSPYLGDAVPGETGRRTYDSDDWRWSEPNPFGRAAEARKLLYGQLTPADAQKFVLSTGARFVLQSCRSRRTNLERTLRPIISSVHRFGCATVYRIA